MKGHTAQKFSGGAGMILIIVLSGVLLSPFADAQTPPEPIEDQPAERVFHNIHILKGMRAGDLQGAMSFIASSLGVDCDYCHRGEDFGRDIRKEKSRAREMIEMVRQINQSAFHGENKVNCFTCHQGHTEPISTAPITLPTTHEGKTGAAAGAPPGGALPSVDEVLAHYIGALGGQAALNGIKTRITHTEPLEQRGGDSKTVSMTYQKMPAKVLVANESASYSSWVGFNGQRAWAQDSLKSYWGILNTPQRNSIMRESEMYAGSRIQAQYKDVKVARKEKIGSADTYVITGLSPEKTNEEFFFDAQSGLLRRRHIVEHTVFGDFQVQADFDDLRINEPIDDEKFERAPAVSTQPAHTN